MMIRGNEMKKTVLKLIGIAFAAVCVIAPAKEVKAMVGMPCTNIIIQNGTNALNAAQAAYDQANAVVNQAQAAYNQAIASGTEVDKTNAFVALNAAKTKLEEAKNQITVAQMNVRDASSNAKNEQYYLDMKDKWNGSTVVEADRIAAQSAQGVANQAQQEIVRLNNVIAQASTVSSLAGTIPGLKAQLAAAEADYANKKALADAATAKLNNDLQTVNYATAAENAAYVNYVQMIKDYHLKDDCKAYANGHMILHWYD